MLGSTTNDNTYVMTVLNDDGTFGIQDTAVKPIPFKSSTLGFDGKSLTGDMADGTSLSIHNVAGVKVAETVVTGGHASVDLPAGIYFANDAEGNTLKFFVK